MSHVRIWSHLQLIVIFHNVAIIVCNICAGQPHEYWVKSQIDNVILYGKSTTRQSK